MEPKDIVDPFGWRDVQTTALCLDSVATTVPLEHARPAPPFPVPAFCSARRTCHGCLRLAHATSPADHARGARFPAHIAAGKAWRREGRGDLDQLHVSGSLSRAGAAGARKGSESGPARSRRVAAVL